MSLLAFTSIHTWTFEDLNYMTLNVRMPKEGEGPTDRTKINCVGGVIALQWHGKRGQREGVTSPYFDGKLFITGSSQIRFGPMCTCKVNVIPKNVVFLSKIMNELIMSIFLFLCLPFGWGLGLSWTWIPHMSSDSLHESLDSSHEGIMQKHFTYHTYKKISWSFTWAFR